PASTVLREIPGVGITTLRCRDWVTWGATSPAVPTRQCSPEIALLRPQGLLVLVPSSCSAAGAIGTDATPRDADDESSG
ncbi:MAG: hypothetical protein M1840_001115, partial [Geoglossum simile]